MLYVQLSLPLLASAPGGVVGVVGGVGGLLLLLLPGSSAGPGVVQDGGDVVAVHPLAVALHPPLLACLLPGGVVHLLVGGGVLVPGPCLPLYLLSLFVLWLYDPPESPESGHQLVVLLHLHQF